MSSLIGTTLENYDFFIYGTAAALVFNTLFFPGSAPATATLATFAVFATGFLARPLGGALFGHLGDRVGRKSMLVTTLLVMGFATAGIGLLPTYAAIGGWASALLVALRLLQGLAAGGEWGGAAVMTVECAPDGKRGFYGGFTQIAVPIAFILANLVYLPLTTLLSHDQLASWGWRIPFLLGAALVICGLVIRLKVNESPVFTEARTTHSASRPPIVQVWRKYPRVIALTTLAVTAPAAIGYIKNVYLLSYGTQILHISRTTLLVVCLVNALVEAVQVVIFARLSDRIGRKKVFVFGGVVSALWAVPFVLLIDTKAWPLILLGLVVTGVGSTAMFAPLAALLAESFTPEVRYTGVSMGFQFGSTVGGGLAPLISAALFAATGSVLSMAAYIVLLSLVSLGAIAFIRETADQPLSS
ncbi:MFS transporter [Streptomyces sp. NPDC096354]|uniref:MFS transporter n=1 Tax=Streptomyces sp. NPDC096354 TaxID=3366088 RepID=UPI00381828CE